jgi:hypothetical protein
MQDNVLVERVLMWAGPMPKTYTFWYFAGLTVARRLRA